MAIIEGYWDCSYCGNVEIRGREQACPNCGKTRSADVKFYMREKTPVVDESKIEKGPDWYCPYCDSYNPHSATACKNCGHPREAEDKNYFQVRREEEAKKREANQPTVQSYREVEPPVAKPYTSSNHTNPQPSTQHTIPSYHRHERRPRPDCAAIARGGCHK